MIRETISSALCTIATVLAISGGALMTVNPVKGLLLMTVAVSFGIVALFVIEED